MHVCRVSSCVHTIGIRGGGEEEEIDGIRLEEKVPGNPDERGQGEEPGRTGDEGGHSRGSSNSEPVNAWQSEESESF